MRERQRNIQDTPFYRLFINTQNENPISGEKETGISDTEKTNSLKK